MKTETKDVTGALQERWLQHNLSLLEVTAEKLKENGGEIRLLDLEALNSMRLFARDEIRPATQRELRSAHLYDPLLANQPIIIVKFSTPQGAQHHVMNGNNRVFLFGCAATNPHSLPLPVIVFDSPEGMQNLLGADPWCSFNRARPFNFNNN